MGNKHCTIYGIATVVDIIVSLPRGRIQEIKRFMLVNLTHGLFLTCTQKSHYIYRLFIAIFTRYTTFPSNLTPCISKGNPAFLTWRTSFFARGDKYPSTLVSSLPTTVLPLALPLSPFHTPQFNLHYLHRRHQQSWSSSSGTIRPKKNIKGIVHRYLSRVESDVNW
jgi:hypothetical protein